MSKETTPITAAQKLDQRTAKLKEARARLRKKQRLEQAKRQQEMTQSIEAVAAAKLTPAAAQSLGTILAILVAAKINHTYAIGALLEARENLAGPDGSKLRQRYGELAKAHLNLAPASGAILSD